MTKVMVPEIYLMCFQEKILGKKVVKENKPNSRTGVASSSSIVFISCFACSIEMVVS